MEQRILKLAEELSSFSGFRIPDDLKSSIASISSKKNVSLMIPINLNNSPIVKTFVLIVTNVKTMKLCANIVNSACESMFVNCFESDALISMLNALSFFSQNFVDESQTDLILKLLQLYSSLLPKYFTKIHVLKALFYASLSLVTYPIEIVSSTAFASSQQMISHFFNFIKTYDKPLTDEEILAIRSAMNLDFKNQLYTIGYLILYDISAQIFEKPQIWLDLPKLPIQIIFRLWELIITSHHSLIESEPLMLDIIESSAIMPIIDTSEISFLVSFNAFYISSLPSTVIALFSYFLQCCCQHDDQGYVSLMYFRSLFYCSPEFVASFCNFCDQKGSLFDALLETLDGICEEFVKSPVHLSTSPIKVPEKIDTTDKIVWETAPFEICLAIIHAFANLSFLPPKSAKYSSSDSLFSKTDEAISNSRKYTDPLDSIKVSKNSVSQPLTPNIKMEKQRHYSTIQDQPDYNGFGPIRDIVALIWPRLLALLVKATRYADEESCRFVFDGFHELLKIFLINSVQEGRALVLRILCGLAAKQRISKEDPIPLEVLSNNLLHKNKNGLFFKKKHEMAYDLLIKLLYSNPQLFSRLFLRLFITFSVVPETKIDPTFSIRLENAEVTRLCTSVIKGNSYCIKFIASVLVVNKIRFDMLYNAILPSIVKQFDEPENRGAVYYLFTECLSKCVTESSEIPILSTITALLSKDYEINYVGSSNKSYKALSSISSSSLHSPTASSPSNNLSKHRGMVLNEIRTLVLNSSIKSGWPYILKCIHFHDDMEITITFSILNAICNDQFSKLSDEGVNELIKIIFEYATQKIDINISLSSLGLLWIVIPFVKSNSKYWKLILSETIILFSDMRNDVAICAVKTFFSLLTTNTGQMPKDIFEHLIDNCFINQLMAMADFPQAMWGVHQLILQEMCHCAISFWKYFIKLPQFTQTFWELIIGKQASFLSQCHDQEINANAFQFYEECFEIPYFEIQMREFLTNSFYSVADNFLRRESQKSLVLCCIGRHVNKIILSQKPYLTETITTIWVNLVAEMCKYLLSDQILNLSTEKGIQALDGLFPLEKEISSIICHGYVQIIIDNGKFVRDEIFKSFKRIIKYDNINIVRLLIDLKPIYYMEETQSLLLELLSRDITSNNMNLFKCFIILASNEENTDLDSISNFKKSENINNIEKSSNADKVNVSRELTVCAVDKILNFISQNSKNTQVLKKVWSKFCDPNSTEFSKCACDICFDEIIESFKNIIQANFNDEKALLDTIRFLEKIRSPPRKINDIENCDVWHLIKLFPNLKAVMNDKRIKISKGGRRIYRIIYGKPPPRPSK